MEDAELQKHKMLCDPKVLDKLAQPQITLIEVEAPEPESRFHWMDFLIGAASTIGSLLLFSLLLKPKKQEPEEELIVSERKGFSVKKEHGKRRSKSEDSDGDE